MDEFWLLMKSIYFGLKNAHPSEKLLYTIIQYVFLMALLYNFLLNTSKLTEGGVNWISSLKYEVFSIDFWCGKYKVWCIWNMSFLEYFIYK